MYSTTIPQNKRRLPFRNLARRSEISPIALKKGGKTLWQTWFNPTAIDDAPSASASASAGRKKRDFLSLPLLSSSPLPPRRGRFPAFPLPGLPPPLPSPVPLALQLSSRLYVRDFFSQIVRKPKVGHWVRRHYTRFTEHDCGSPSKLLNKKLEQHCCL